MTTESNIPEIFLSINSSDHHGVLGSYCWNNICITKVMPSNFKDDVNKTQLRRDDTVSIHVKNFTNPEKFHVTVFLKGGAIIMNIDTVDKFAVNLQNGFYIINVSAGGCIKVMCHIFFPLK